MSACYLADHMSIGGAFTLTCIDPEFQPEFWSNIARCSSPDRVRAIQKKSQDALLSLPCRPFQLIHIDGWHIAPQVFIDGLFSMPLLADGGYVIFDDYLKEDQTTKNQPVKAGVQAFWEVFAPWLDVVIDGRQLACRFSGSLCLDSVVSKTESVLKAITGKATTFKERPADFADLCQTVARDHMDDLFSVSWGQASAFRIPKRVAA
ncbi:class I SAM-dependent methyltransferase [Methylorubrum populi]|nr:class I SAM-dependent methyltransferase [Methylorubrum populi]